jgi:hypothetical protein
MAQATAQNALLSGVTVKVDYADVAGAYAGWFLLVVQGDNLIADSDFNPANGPSSATALSENNSGVGDSVRYRVPFLTQVNARLDHMFGVGHSVRWSALIIKEVTPAVIDDDWV